MHLILTALVVNFCLLKIAACGIMVSKEPKIIFRNYAQRKIYLGECYSKNLAPRIGRALCDF